MFEIFYTNIENRLKKYEFLRCILFLLVITLECGLVGLLFYAFLTDALTFERAHDNKIVFMLVLVGFGIYYFIKKKFEADIKTKIIEEFLECFENFQWEYWTLGESFLDDKVLKETHILPHFTQSISDDNFQGKYKNLPIIISEQKLLNGAGIYSTNVFDGIVIEYTFAENSFPAEIIVRDSGGLPPKGLNKITLEDIEFNKMFNVYSDNQIESRFILTTGFMEKLKALKILFDVKHISASFLNSKMYLAVDIGKDSFNIAKLHKPVNDKKLLEKMYNQFDFILKIADLLRITKYPI